MVTNQINGYKSHFKSDLFVFCILNNCSETCFARCPIYTWSRFVCMASIANTRIIYLDIRSRIWNNASFAVIHAAPLHAVDGDPREQPLPCSSKNIFAARKLNKNLLSLFGRSDCPIIEHLLLIY